MNCNGAQVPKSFVLKELSEEAGLYPSHPFILKLEALKQIEIKEEE